MSIASIDLTETTLPTLPSDLEDYKLIAPQTVRGGGEQDLLIIRRPQFLSEKTESEKLLLAAWDTWWYNTLWGKDTTKSRPRWNSSCRTGTIWSYYGEAALLTNGHPYVYCYNCGLILQHPNVNSCGTKHLASHQKSLRCNKTEIPIHEQTVEARPLPKKHLRNQSSTFFSPQAYEEKLVQLVIDHNWSFRTVERRSFQQFVRFLQPNAVITSRYKFRQLFKDQFRAAEAAILQDLGSTTKLSIALDAWTSGNHLSFLAVKGYYINNAWQLREKLLEFIPVRGRHSGLSMAKEVLQLLKSAGIIKRLLAITCDNASNNSTLSQTLESKLQEEGCSWSSRENTIPCLAHVINLVVQDIIYHLKLSASPDDEQQQSFKRQHVKDIQAGMSVPNSLKKVSYIYHVLLTHY